MINLVVLSYLFENARLNLLANEPFQWHLV